MIQSRTSKAVFLASGQVLTSSAQLLGFIVLSRVLSINDYSTYRQTMLSYSFAAPLLMLGLPQALYYFIPRMKERARGILLENLMLLCSMGLIFSLFLLFGGNRFLAWRFSNPSLENTLLILAPYPLFMLPAEALSACLMAQDRVKQLAAFNVFSRVVMLGIIIAAGFIWRSPAAVILGIVISSSIVLLPSVILMFRSTQGSSDALSVAGMLSQIKFSVPLGLAGIIGGLSFSIDKIIVSSMCLPKDFAIYSNGAFEIPLTSVVTGSITAVLLPDLAKLFNGGQKAEAVALWKRSATKSAVILLPSMFFMFFMAPEIISVLFSNKYADSSLPFRIYSTLLPVRVVTFGAMIMAAGISRWILWRSIGDLIINSALSLLLVSQIGYIGAAVASVITVYVWSVPISLMVISKEYNSRISNVLPYSDFLKISAVSALASIVLIPNFFIDTTSNILRLLIFSPLYLAGVVFLLTSMKLIDKNSVGNLLHRFLRS